MRRDAIEELVERKNARATAMRRQLVEGLHSDHHCKREKRDDAGRDNRVHHCQKIGPPSSELEPAPQQRPGQAHRGPVKRRIDQRQQTQKQQQRAQYVPVL